jgi:hypothetical protein
LLALGGVIIALVLIFSAELALTRANSSAIALVAATAVFLCGGVFALVKPALSGLLGVAGVVSVVVSLVGAPFGAIFGVLLSVLGGNRCYAWSPDTDAEN